jgi:FkbM family methyltransferase
MRKVNLVLEKVGLRICRGPSASLLGPYMVRTRKTPLRVGKFDLLTVLRGHLYQVYRANPDYMSELGRTAAAVFAKYPDMVCVDVGACIGDTAAIIRTACPAPIVCIEGDPSLADVLTENAGRIGGVSLIYNYLSDHHGSQRVTIDKEGWNSTLVPFDSTDEGSSVSFLTLDEALRDDDAPRVKLLKIDTEGFDGRVLRGAQQLLRTSHPVVLFEYNRGNLAALHEDGLEIFANLRACGYHSALFWDDSGRFILGTMLEDRQTIEDLHDYVDVREKTERGVDYLDVCVFHRQDEDVYRKCLDAERAFRRRKRGATAAMA